MTEAEEPDDRFLKLPKVLEIAGIGRTRVYELMSAGEFPKAMKIGKSSVWSENEIKAWQKDIKSQNGRH